jgi:hypothetical protein
MRKVMVLVALGAHAPSAQPAAFKRTVLQKADVSTPGCEVVQAHYTVEKGKPLATSLPQ